MPAYNLTDDVIDQYGRDGVVVLRGLFTDKIDLIAAAIDAGLNLKRGTVRTDEFADGPAAGS